MTANSHPNPSAESTLQVCIGVCTRGRPEQLRRLLDSLAVMEIPPGACLDICVVENDSEPRSRDIVEAAAGGMPVPVCYRQESRIGIPQARNHLLDYALSTGAQALLLVDDDEEVDQRWLTSMLEFAAKTGWRAVIQGRVIARMPSEEYLHLLPFFTRSERQTGESLSLCASNNTLVPMSGVARYGLRFDERRPDEGGEDTIFFSLCRQKGIPLLFCQEAVVTETIEPSRANLRWLSLRKFRVGLLMGSGLIAGKERSAAKSAFYLGKSVGSFVICVLLTLCLQRDRSIRAWLNGVRSLGYGLGYFRIQVHPYRQAEVR